MNILSYFKSLYKYDNLHYYKTENKYNILNNNKIIFQIDINDIIVRNYECNILKKYNNMYLCNSKKYKVSLNTQLTLFDKVIYINNDKIIDIPNNNMILYNYIINPKTHISYKHIFFFEIANKCCKKSIKYYINTKIIITIYIRYTILKYSSPILYILNKYDINYSSKLFLIYSL
jgi:hypothetical protein